MPAVIDWHAHHTPPELIERFAALGEKPPRMDPEDDTDFEGRISDMDDAGVDVQLVSPGAGVNGDRFGAETALDFAHLANDVIAERISYLGGVHLEQRPVVRTSGRDQDMADRVRQAVEEVLQRG